MSDSDTRSLYLFADSQPLFWNGGAFLASICESSANTQSNVAYIGASNGDSADAHGIFMAAFEQVPTAGTHWVRTQFNQEDQDFLDTADVIVLAGGDVEAGWKVFTETGMRESIERRYREGAILLGVSAGAAQLGRYATVAGSYGGQKLVETFGLLLAIVDVHDEKRDWQELSSTIELLEGALRGIGIPHGAALIVHADGTCEPVGRPVEEFVLSNGRLRRSVLLADGRNGERVVS